VQEAARPGSVAARAAGPGRSWLLPYLVIAVIAAIELAAARLSVGGFVALAPLLASRVSSRRGQVLAAGVTAALVGFVLGVYTGKAVGGQLALRLLLIVLATLFALVNWGAARREQSALERAADTIQLAAGLAAGVEPEEAYARLARSARTLYAAQATAVYRRHDAELVVVAQSRDRGVPPMPVRLARSSFPGAFGTGPRRASIRSGDAPEASMLDVRGLGSLLWLPLLDRDGDLIGTIVLAWRRRDPRLSAQALEASQQFASLGARTISGSERVRAQTEVLEQVQALLLTTPPAWAAGFQVGVRYQSASGLAQIGGDFYDVVEVDERGLAFILADARGKGLEASSLAAVLKGAFRSLAGEGAGPARILNRLDRLVDREGGDEDFVTALAGRLYPDGRVLLASAGHPAPLGLGPRLVQVAAPLGLGTLANESQGHLRPGERLICYTDGLVEARNAAGEFIDRARFEEAAAAGSLTDALDHLVELVDRHAEGRHQDDLALLGLEYDPDGPA
jgi:serine phosphatase RsbU (regulator of sigma subunit)